MKYNRPSGTEISRENDKTRECRRHLSLCMYDTCVIKIDKAQACTFHFLKTALLFNRLILLIITH